jgi:23S rRNA (cytosine1962-C5)-methyltransferase
VSVRRIVLKPGREGPVRSGHPWIFSGAVADGLDACTPGDVVRVASANGRFVAMGYANPRTTIAVRVLSLHEEEIDDAFVGRRLDEALALRRATLPADLDCHRIVNGEGDRLPGVVVDRYGTFVVCQFLTAGADRLAPAVVRGIEERLEPSGVFERSEGGVRAEEGLPGARGVRAGQEPPARLTIHEGDCAYLVDVLHGQKTGFFLDQRESRARVRTLADGRRVLNAFAYSGAFAIAAARGGAREVVSVDTSKPSLALGEAAWAANGLDPERGSFVVADVFDYLRGAQDPFDLIVLDPPPFVRRRRDLESGLRGYRDVNLQAFRRLAPGGWLVTSSCSQHLSRGQFRDVVAAAAADAGRPATVVGESGHPPDHPTALAHVEGEYLKVLWLRA